MIEAEYIDHMGDDLAVVNAARVSFDAEDEKLNWRGERLIDYLARHKHKSPFNHTFLKFRCHAPVFVARQLQKHEYLPWNEVSRRYIDSEPEFYVPDAWRKRAENVKQGSSDEEVTMLCMGDDGQQARGLPKLSHSSGRIRQSVGVAYAQLIDLYNEMLASGVCPEQARMVLPQSMITTWIWSGSLYAFAKMCALRTDSHAQKEASYVAQPILETLEHLFPVSTRALMKHGAD